MGGKQNRTRNNVRPSNSGRSAAMLHSSLPQFSGFSSSNKNTPLSMLAFSPLDELDKSIDTNFQLVLKKVSKKDATTKLKGLQEFTELLQNADSAAIKDLLPTWPRFYNILVIHPDNRIREATQIAHAVIVQKAKRDIAPYLKQLMAPWYTSQYDNYPPAASAAIKAFKDTFSPLKFKEAIAFCQPEIINYIHDNLLVQSAQTVSSSQLSPQEAEARYERMVISCLQGYAMYLKEVPEEKVAESEDLNSQIVSNKKFWKLAQSKVALIRSSWFQVLSVIFQKARHLLNGKEAQAFSTIFNSLGDQEVMVIPDVWECLLLAASIPEFWSSINIEQSFIPKLLNILKNGGNGNASIIYPNLLPLLANLPTIEEKKLKQFYLNFFENMILGLKLKQTANNNQEFKSIAQAYIECLQFLLTRNTSNSDLCVALATQLCSLLEWCLSRETSQISCKVVYSQVATLVTSLLRNGAQAIINHFLKCLQDTFTRALNNPSNYTYISELAMKQVDLLLNLKSCSDAPEFYTYLIDDFGITILKQYMRLIEQGSSNELLESLFSLLNSFDREKLLGGLLEQLKEELIEPQLKDVYKKWFRQWLFDEKMFGKSVLDLVFLLLEEMPSEDGKMVLDDLLKVENPDCIAWSVTIALSSPHISNKAVQEWLKSPTIGNFFVTIVDDYVSEKCGQERMRILEATVTGPLQDSIFVNKEIVDKIMQRTMDLMLTNSGGTNINAACTLACDLCGFIYTPDRQLVYGDALLLAVFKFACQFHEDDIHHPLEKETLIKVDSTWKQCLNVLLRNVADDQRKPLLEKFLKVVKDEFALLIVERNRSRFGMLGEQIASMIEIVQRENPSLVAWIMEYLSEHVDLLNISIVRLCQMAEYVKGTFRSQLDEITVNESIETEDIISYFVNSFLMIEVLRISTDNQENLLDETEEMVASAVHSYMLNTLFLTHFNCIKYYSEIAYYNEISKTSIGDITRVIESSGEFNITAQLARCKGAFWTKAIDVYCTVFTSQNDHIKLYEREENIGINVPGRFLTHIKAFRQANSNNSYASWQDSNQIIDVVEKCIFLMETCELTTEYWDLIVLSLDTWTSDCLKFAPSLVHQYQYQRMLVVTSELFIKTCDRVTKLKADNSDATYVHEWEDILIDSIHSNLVQIWIFLAEHFNSSSQDPLLNLPVLQIFGQLTDYLRYDLILKENRFLPKFLKLCNQLLTNSRTILQLWGYKMLLVLVPGLVKCDEEAFSNTTPHKKGLIFEQFKEKLVSEFQEIVNSMLSDFRIGERSCRVETSYDSYTYTLAYLSLWDVLINFFCSASPELRFQYSEWLKSGSLLHELLVNLFKLMPVGSLLTKDAKETNANYFLNNPLKAVGFSGFCGSDTVEQFACYLFRSSLEQFPALVRQWWTVLDVKMSQIVEKMTVLFVSPIICNMELNNVLQHQSSFKNLKVKIMPTIREIQAVYTLDEAPMELTITLPSNYPLGSSEIVGNKQLSGTSQKQWLLQFKKCVLHQNGKIWDGLTLWNSYLNKKFDGVEECCICYAVLHPGTYQMPKVSCRTCKKKFHSACLYKWFSTSQKSSCPICRNIF